MDVLTAGLAQALVIYYHRHCPRGTRIEDVARGARAVYDNLREQLTGPPPDWLTAEPATVARLRGAVGIGVPVRVAGFISEFRVPHYVDIPNGNGGRQPTLTTSITVRDPRGLAIEAVDIVGDALVNDAFDLAQRRGMVEILGRIISIPEALGRMCHKFMFEVTGIRRTRSILDLMGATGPERGWVATNVKALVEKNIAPIEFVFTSVAGGLGIVGLDQAPHLRRALQFVCLQALSGGAVGKLSGALIGGPGTGKTTLSRAARAINPRFAEITSARPTLAGIAGASYASASGWTSTPGILDVAHEGTAIWPDMHAVNGQTFGGFEPALASIMEYGRLADANAGGRDRDVAVGLLFDMNRIADGGVRRECAFLCSRPLTSRLQFVEEFPTDNELIWSLSAQRAETAGTLTTSRPEDEPWARPLQLIIAYLRDAHADVDLSAARAPIRDALESIYRENRERFALIPEASDIPARLSDGLFRIAVANARGHARSYTTIEDVGVAVELIQGKLRLLGITGDGNSAPPPQRGFEARAAVYARHAGEVVDVKDLAREIQETTGDGMKTARRDLERLGATRVGPGQYRLPNNMPAGGGDDEADE